MVYARCQMNHSAIYLWDRLLNIDDAGTICLKMGESRIGSTASPMQRACSWADRGTVPKYSPPYSTHKNWMIKMRIKITTKRVLLKKLRKTLISDLSFLALIWLNTCNNTKVWKKRQKCFPLYSVHSYTPIDDCTPNSSGPELKMNLPLKRMVPRMVIWRITWMTTFFHISGEKMVLLRG